MKDIKAIECCLHTVSRCNLSKTPMHKALSNTNCRHDRGNHNMIILSKPLAHPIHPNREKVRHRKTGKTQHKRVNKYAKSKENKGGDQSTDKKLRIVIFKIYKSKEKSTTHKSNKEKAKVCVGLS